VQILGWLQVAKEGKGADTIAEQDIAAAASTVVQPVPISSVVPVPVPVQHPVIPDKAGFHLCSIVFTSLLHYLSNRLICLHLNLQAWQWMLLINQVWLTLKFLWEKSTSFYLRNSLLN
jgi:hypothetical protein